jgi:exopolyphosphatase / guanosine-5'-triphosphate,3'-diphosphate pyrophosphatase
MNTMDGRGEAQDARGPFGRSLFDDPSVRALSRVGVVDVGSNSVRLVVFDGAARSPAYFYNEKIMCALGSGLAQTGRLNPNGKARALAALKRFKLLAEGMGAAPLTVVATAAVREAEDGPAFREELERETGLRLWVIDGDQEARLSAQGVLLGWPGAYGMVCDIGGSSMELAELRGGLVGRRVTSPLGPFRLANVAGGKKGLKAHIAKITGGLRAEMGDQRDRLFLVGGSWRAFARVDMLRRNYPLLVLHEYRMSRADVSATVDFIDATTVAELIARTGISEARMSLVPVAAQVLKELVKTFKPHDIAVSSYGIREGMLYEQMPQRLRDRDPLLEACRFAEEKDSRLPGFGDQLFTFIRPLFRNVDEERERIIRAACLLHDVSWRAHPDYRHEVCFDYATRANLGGLNHRERVYIGLALLHRYKNSREGSRFEPLYRLLDEDELRQAEVVGKAMRFGAMFSGQVAERMGELRWFPKKKLLELKLSRGSEALFGEVAEARFKSLVQALGATSRVS